MLFKHILSIYGSFKHMSEMLKSEPTHYMEEEEEDIENRDLQTEMNLNRLRYLTD